MRRYRFVFLSAQMIITLWSVGCSNSTGPTGVRPKVTVEMAKSLRVGSTARQVEAALGSPKSKQAAPNKADEELWDYGNQSKVVLTKGQLSTLEIEGKNCLGTASASPAPK